MSHVVTVKLEIKNPAAIQAAVDRMAGATLLNNGEVMEHAMYGGQKRRGIGLQLANWSHPVVIDTETGEVFYDNFGGRWGAQDCLDEFVQAYSVEQIKLEALLHGHVVTEELAENGEIKLTINDYST